MRLDLIFVVSLVPLPFMIFATVQKSRTVRTNPSSFWLMLATASIAVAVTSNSLAYSLDANRQDARAPYALDLLSHAFAAIGICMLYETVIVVGRGSATARRTRTARYIITGLMLVGLTATYLAARLKPASGQLMDTYAQDPWMLGHWAIMISLMLWASTGVAVQNGWLARHSPPGPGRAGLILMSIGPWVGDGYLLHKLYYLVARNLGFEHGPLIDNWSNIGLALFVICLTLFTVGSYWVKLREGPIVRPPLDGLARRRLRALWDLLRPAVPDSIVPQSGGASLYQRVIEIRDAVLALNTYIDATTYAAIRKACPDQGTEDETRALTAATTIVVAVRAKEGRFPVGDALAEIEAPQVRDLWGEYAALVKVARNLPEASRIADHLEHELGTLRDAS